MGLKLWLKWMPVYSLLKQQPSEPRVKRLSPTSPGHEQKVEKGWGRVWDPRRAATHPMVILMKLERVFWVETMMHSTSKDKGEGSGTQDYQHRMDPGL